MKEKQFNFQILNDIGIEFFEKKRKMHNKNNVRRVDVNCEIYVVKLPDSIKAVSKTVNGKTYIVVNSNLDEEQQKEAIRQLRSGE